MNKIIACVDDSPAAATVAAYAAWACGQLGTTLEFLHVLDRHPETAGGNDYSGNLVADSQEHLLQQLSDEDASRSKTARERGRQVLESAKAIAREAGVAEPDGRLRHGSLLDNLNELASGSELIVTGQRHHEDGKARAKLHLDHTLEGIIRGLKCPLLATLDSFHTPSNVLIAFDGSATARSNIERISRNPLLTGLHFHVVMACKEKSPLVDKMLEWARETLSSRDLATSTTAAVGEPHEVLRTYALENAVDLMVIGAFGHSMLRQLVFGSTTTTLLRTSPVPVLVLR